MQIEELSKSQIVLLTLLVSFVTSIATGIVTVALVEQAPPAVTQNVSRVIQETVQAVTPTSQHATAASPVQEKTVVVNESDLVSSAVSRASPSLVRLYAGDVSEANFFGFGIVLDTNGMLAADAMSLGDSAEATVLTADGTTVRAFVRSRDDTSGIAYLLAATSSDPITWTPVVVNTEHATLGESVIMLGGKTSPRIAEGLVVSLLPTDDASSSLQVVDTNIGASSILPGSPLIDTQGAILGLSSGLSEGISGSGFISASALHPPSLK